MEETEKPKISADGIQKRNLASRMGISVSYLQNMRRNQCSNPVEYAKLRRLGKTMSKKMARIQKIRPLSLY